MERNSGTALETTRSGGEFEGLQLSADLTGVCRATVLGDRVTIEGLFGDSSLVVMRQLAGSLQELAAELTGTRQSDINHALQVVVDMSSNSQAVLCRFTFPATVMPQFETPEMHAALHAFALEVGKGADECDLAQLPPRSRELINAALTKIKKAHGSKALPAGLKLTLLGSNESVPFPSTIGDASESNEVGPPRQAHGAFRGFFIEARQAFFIEAGAQKKRKPLILSFDEERYFESIKTLSNRHFTTCTVTYIEHFKSGKLEYLQLLDITGTNNDMFE